MGAWHTSPTSSLPPEVRLSLRVLSVTSACRSYYLYTDVVFSLVFAVKLGVATGALSTSGVIRVGFSVAPKVTVKQQPRARRCGGHKVDNLRAAGKGSYAPCQRSRRRVLPDRT